MGPSLTVLVLLLLAAGLFYGGRQLRRSQDGSRRLADLVGRYPTVIGVLLLVVVAGIIALGLWALLLAAP